MFGLHPEAKALSLPMRPESHVGRPDRSFIPTSIQYTLPDRTLFAGINPLRPGHFLLAANGSVRTAYYWDLNYSAAAVTNEPPRAGTAALVEEFQNLFFESVSLRMRSDAPFCCHLSGGLDSSAVLGAAMKFSAKPLHAFCVSFESEEYDEIQLARESAAFAGAELQTVRVTQSELIGALSDAVYFSEGLAVNGHLAAKFLLNRAIQKAGFKAVLAGEGADEIAAGYPHLRIDLFRSEGREDLLEALAAANPASRGIMLAHGGFLPLSAVKSRLGFVPGFLEAKGSLGFKMHAVLSAEFKTAFARRDAYADWLDAIDIGQLRHRHPVDQSLYIWTKSALANYILKTLGDGAEMAHSVEGRLPFLDHHLFEFVRRLPMNMLINGTLEKFILREAARPFITDRIYRRRKHPFLAPPIFRFSNPVTDGTMIRRHVAKPIILATMPFFDQKKVVALLDERPSISAADQTAMDPVLMTALTAAILNERFKL